VGKVLAKVPKIYFHENLFCGFEVVTCSDESSGGFFFNCSLRALQQEMSSPEKKGGVRSSVKLQKMF
jgi:hypothetical protein